MKALVKYEKGPGHVAIQEMPTPECQPNQVILEVDSCGICGTDLHVYHDTFKNYPPVILGHEFSGKVVETGKAVNGIHTGDAFSVLGAVAITCGHCAYCRSGEFMFCPNRRGMGHGVNGAFTRYVAVRPDQLYAIPQGITMREAALVEPLAAAVHAVCDVARFKLGDIALVSGPGPIGLLVLKLLVAQGIETIVAGISQDEFRLQKALEYGAAHTVAVDKRDLSAKIQEITKGRGVDIAFEVAGAESSVRNCLDNLRPLGHYVQVGHFGKDLTVPWDHIAFRQLRIDGSVGYTRETWTQTMQILEQGQVKVGDTITHELPLEQWREGFDLMEQKQAIKIILKP